MNRYGLDGSLSRLPQGRAPAFVTAGLNLVRPLGYAGIPVIGASPDAGSTVFKSRYCSLRCLLPALDQREALMETLVEVGAKLSDRFGRRIPLIYGNDDWLELIQQNRDVLEQRFALVLNDPDVADSLIAKDRFGALARDRGVPVPQTLSWGGNGPDSLVSHAGPVLVKPRMKVAWEHSAALIRLFGGGWACKARVFENGPAVHANPLAQQLRGLLTFQEYVAGDDRSLWSFHGFADEAGTLLASFVGRKIRTFPALTGSSSYVELAHDEAVAAAGRDAVARFPLKGPFKIDFKRDARTGKLYVLEVNARYTLWNHLGACNGVNVPQIACDYLLDGRRPGAQAYGTEVRWLCLPLDYRSHRELAAKGRSTLPGWIASLARSRRIYDVFSWSDPAPCVQAWRSWLASRLEGLSVKCRLRMQRWRSTAS